MRGFFFFFFLQCTQIQQMPMHLHRFLFTRNLFSSIASSTRYFASNSYINKVSLYLERARLIDSIRLSLRSNPPSSLIPLLNDPALDSFVVTNALRSAPSPDSALSLIETLKSVPHFSHNQNTLYTLAKILAESQQTAKLKALIDAINSGKFTNVARISFMDQMQWFAAAGDLDAVVHVWDEWRASLQRRPCTESYNIVMGVYAQMGKNPEAVKIFDRMIAEGAIPNSRTYTVLIKHLVNSGKLDSAMEIFKTLPLMRIKHTLRQYSLLVGAFTSTEQFHVVKNLLDEMRIDGILPGQAMRWALQRMQEAGFVEETDEFVKEMLPDKRIKNVGFPMDDEDEDEDEDANCASGDVDVDGVQLKPWLDPAALASSLHYWGPEEVSALESAKFVWTTRLVCKMIKNFKSAETAWEFFCWVAYQPTFTHDVYTVSRTIAKLARHGLVDLVDHLMSKIKREGIRLSFSTIRLIIDFYGISGKGDAALKVFRDAKTLCGPISKSGLLLLYSSLLRTLAKCKMNSDALDILEEMILCGILPDIQTFSGLMHHFALQGDIKMVQRLFGMVRQSGLEPDAYMYKVLIRVYCKCERPVLALRVFEDMRNSTLMPDSATKQLLVKSLWKEGRLKEAAAVEERSEEINAVLPLALPGHVYTVSSADLMRIYNIYSSCFTTTKA
uniref:Pentacotripeptide-repeat region of PRORP domain-containing protein n=1 Tax=Davidia involucrata TaxID=16924 RepID=A0A5B7AD21_DAVIN